MDRNRLDVLARLLSTTGSRRVTLGMLVGAGLLGHDPDTLAKGRKEKDGGDGSRGVQREGRPGTARKKHHQRKQTQRQRRQKRHRNDSAGKPRENGVCCADASSCAPPEPGGSSAKCDYVGQTFAGQDLHGVDFRQIAGVNATFDQADLRGALFSNACLRRASFRGANLAGTIWEGACLFAVDLTDADVGDDPDALSSAVLCATILPDGSRSDRDCDRSEDYPCCLPPPGGGGGGEGCDSCAAADQCHVPGNCVCTCTTAMVPNGTPCDDGNPLCLAGVCCADSHKAINGGCFKIGGPSGEGCNRETCDGFIRDCPPFAEDCGVSVCVKSTAIECNRHTDCPAGQACNHSARPGQCYAPC